MTTSVSELIKQGKMLGGLEQELADALEDATTKLADFRTLRENINSALGNRPMDSSQSPQWRARAERAEAIVAGKLESIQPAAPDEWLSK